MVTCVTKKLHGLQTMSFYYFENATAKRIVTTRSTLSRLGNSTNQDLMKYRVWMNSEHIVAAWIHSLQQNSIPPTHLVTQNFSVKKIWAPL